MYKLLFFMTLAGHSLGQQYQQKVAPGVPPQNYQQQQNYQQPPPPPPPQQQYQPPPPQQQQMNQQQIPPQQFQQQQPPQQQPPQQQQQQAPVQPQVQHQGGHGHHHQGDPQLLNTANIAQERDHIQEHMDVPIDTSKMSDQELQFHYFKMHDNDNNNKLDGCELIKSLIHWHEEQGAKQQPGTAPGPDKIFPDEELVSLIDPILTMDDQNKDGYIDYPEFVRAQQKQPKQ